MTERMAGQMAEQTTEQREIVGHTYSVCPVCLKRIPAARVRREGGIYLER